MNMHTRPVPAGSNRRWTEDLMKRAADMWNDGKSASQICVVFGVSRNSVIGVAHRNPDLFKKKGDAFKGSNKGGKPPKRKKEARGPRGWNLRFGGDTYNALKEARQSDIDAYDEPMPDPKSYDGERLLVAKDLMARNDATDCHWPLNSGGPFVYCCAPKVKGSPYCGPHARRSRSFRAEGV